MKGSLSQLLIGEHDVILKAGAVILHQRGLWLTSPQTYEGMVRQLLDFFSIYADEFHHHKEEEILFPALARKSEITGSAVIQELLEHHQQFREDIQQIRESLAERNFPVVQEYLEGYLRMLKDHIAAENDELFPMAEDVFSPDEMEKLYYRCIDKDRELGIDHKTELETMIQQLEKNETAQ